jgi:hypothetical protein
MCAFAQMSDSKGKRTIIRAVRHQINPLDLWYHPEWREQATIRWLNTLKCGDPIVIRVETILSRGGMRTITVKDAYCAECNKRDVVPGLCGSVDHIGHWRIFFFSLNYALKFGCQKHRGLRHEKDSLSWATSCTSDCARPLTLSCLAHSVELPDQEWINTFRGFGDTESLELLTGAMNCRTVRIPRELCLLIMSYCFVPAANMWKS